MILGLFSLLYGSAPGEFNRWHLAMYPDAHDWVSLPNAVGMSQFADGGLVGTKPYCASGAYMNRMSNYCRECRYDPRNASGDEACPFTTLYWSFLRRHRDRFSENKRMMFQMKNLDRKNEENLDAIAARETEIRSLAKKGEL
jgi:deoxyribodipyrimidine photolyase-related protein